MSEKPVVNAQECDPSTLGLARKPRPALKRKPQTEVVVQLGPYTDGQITAPEMVRPLEGPTEWLIKPKTGEIVPFDAGTPPEKDVIRKYITVGAQDNDVPEDLPKLSEGYVVERVNQDPLPSMDGKVGENGTNTVRVVEKEGPASVECKDMPPPTPVDENEEPPPVDPPVDEEEDCECPTPPTCPPVDEPDCKTDPDCPEVDAVNDCASTKTDCPVIVDVLKNDLGCGDLKINEASAENGTVEIKNGKLHYTPNEGFCGEDVISYTIGDESCLTDTAHVYIKVDAIDVAENDNDYPADNTDCADNTDSSDYTGNTQMGDHEYSSEQYTVDSVIEAVQENVQTYLDQARDQANEYIQSKTAWASGFSASAFDSANCAPAEEAAAVC
jgi:hypothetical protein